MGTIKQDALPIIEQVARLRTTIPYASVARLLRIRANDHAFHEALGEISNESLARNMGLVSAVVVNKETGMPGKGFFAVAASLGIDVSNPRKAWKAELEKVYEAYSA